MGWTKCIMEAITFGELGEEYCGLDEISFNKDSYVEDLVPSLWWSYWRWLDHDDTNSISESIH